MEGNVEHTIIEICQKRRAEMHATLKEIADGSGLPEITVAKFFGSTPPKSPSFYVVCALCRFLGVSIDEFAQIPIEKDPRAEDLIAQLRADNASRHRYIERAQKTITEKNELIEKQAETIRQQADIINAAYKINKSLEEVNASQGELVKKAHNTSRALVAVLIVLSCVCVCLAAIGVVHMRE